jgi:hypothetical protein
VTEILEPVVTTNVWPVGSEGAHVMPWSEVCVHMGVADKVMGFRVEGTPNREMVQLLTPDGTPFSFPITPGEAGLYRDADGRLYTVEVK